MSSCLHHTHLSSVVVLSSWRAPVTPLAQIAKDLGISESCLRNWMAQADADENGSASRVTSAEKKELAELRRKNRQLEMENEILKRAAAYVARENILPK
jgi:transposase